MSEMTQIPGHVPCLTGEENYPIWKQRMHAFLVCNGLGKYLNGDYLWVERATNTPTTPQTGAAGAYQAGPGLDRVKLTPIEWPEKVPYNEFCQREKAYALMISAMTDAVSLQFTTNHDPTHVWEACAELYGKDNKANVIDLFLVLQATHLSACKTVAAYCEKYITTLRELESRQQVINYAMLQVAFISNTDQRYPSWRERELLELDINKPKPFTKLVSSLREAVSTEQSLQNMAVNNTTAVVAHAERVVTDLCDVCKAGYHTRDKCWYLHPEQAAEGWKPKRAAGVFKHRTDLPKPEKPGLNTRSKRSKALDKGRGGGTNKKTNNHNNNGGGSGGKASQSAHGPDGDGIGLAAATTAFLTLQDPHTWVVDTGATDHMTNSLTGAWNVEHMAVPGSVQTGNGALAAQARCNISMNWINSYGDMQRVTLYNVLFVPGLCSNLISCARMGEKGVEFHTPSGRIMQGTKEIGCAPFDAVLRLWCLKHAALTPMAAAAVTAHQWHQRLGHVAYTGMKAVAEATSGMDVAIRTPAEKCVDCEISKSTRQVNHTPIEPAANIGDLLVGDNVGPFKTPTQHGKRYFTVLTDSATRIRRIYLLTHKNEAHEAVKNCVQRFETQTSGTVKTLRFDGGLEFQPTALRQYCNNKGMRLEITSPYTPEQTGLAERANRLVLDKTRALMRSGKIPDYLWGEAAETAVHILNHTPTSALQGKTPIQRADELLGVDKEKPSIAHLRVYGCRAFVHTHEQQRVARNINKKLGDRAQLGKLVGYEGRSIYRVYVNGRVVRSSHVSFDENVIDDCSVHDASDDAEYVDLSQLLYTRPPQPQQQSSTGRTGPAQEPLPPIMELDELALDHGVDDDVDELQQDLPPVPPAVVVDQVVAAELPQTVSLRRSNRAPKPSAKAKQNEQAHIAHALVAATYTTAAPDPLTWSDMMSSPDKHEWHKANEREMEQLRATGTFDVVPLPQNRRALPTKWVWKRKLDTSNKPVLYKARLVVKGFAQKEGVDYFETYAAVAKFPTFRMLMAFTAFHDLECQQIDMITAFLNGDLDEEVYVHPPQGFPEPHGMVWRLRRTLYGLKQSPRVWYETLSAHLISVLGMRRSDSDPGLFIHNTDPMVFILVYVDDLLIVAPTVQQTSVLKQAIAKQFPIKDLGAAASFLGVRITRHRSARKLTLDQAPYVLRFLSDLGMDNGHHVKTPLPQGEIVIQECAVSQDIKQWYMKTVGLIGYAAMQTRPDIACGFAKLAQHITNPGPDAMRHAKHLLRYLCGTAQARLAYNCTASTLQLVGAADSDYANNTTNRRSHNGYIYLAGGGAVSWQSGLQKITALSTCEAEYVALSPATQEAMWLQELLHEMGYQGADAMPLTILGDNMAANALADNPEFHKRTKHIGVRYHFVREQQQAGRINIKWVSTIDQPADGLTKALQHVKHSRFLDLIGLQL